MAKKKSNRLVFNSPAAIIFSLISILVFALDFFIAKGKLLSFLFTCPGNKNCIISFSVSNPLDYIRLFTRVFASESFSALLVNILFILILSPLMEERFGSVIVTLMMTFSALISGVINLVFSSLPAEGAGPLVFLLIALSALSSLTKKDIPLSWILVFVLYIVLRISRNMGLVKDYGFIQANMRTIADLAGGITGSIFALLVSPKSKNSPKSTTEKNPHAKQKKEKDYSWAPDENSWSSSKKGESEETVIGNLEF